MSESDQDSGTGKLKVTEEYLENFARKTINEFIKSLQDNDDYRNLAAFAEGSPGPGGYGALQAGGDGLPSATVLQQRYKRFCTDLKQQLDTFTKTMGNLSNDLLTINQVLDKGEQDAELTATEMMQDLQDILSGLGGSSATKS